VYPRTLPFIWRNRTHYITADRDNAGRLILKRSASV
jgi:DNA primase